MRTNINFTLSHDGIDWICQNSIIKVKGNNFAALDTNLCKELKQIPEYETVKEVEVLMNFDYSTIPLWLRQYMAHYFNRKVTLWL